MKISRNQLRQIIHEVMKDLEEDALFGSPTITGLQPEKDIPGQSVESACSKCKMRHPAGGCGHDHSDHKGAGRNLSYGNPKAGDHEGRMTRSQLDKIGRYAQSLYDMLNDDDDLPEWVQSKISVIDHDIGKVKHYLEYKIKRMKR